MDRPKKTQFWNNQTNHDPPFAHSEEHLTKRDASIYLGLANPGSFFTYKSNFSIIYCLLINKKSICHWRKRERPVVVPASLKQRSCEKIEKQKKHSRELLAAPFTHILYIKKLRDERNQYPIDEANLEAILYMVGGWLHTQGGGGGGEVAFWRDLAFEIL